MKNISWAAGAETSDLVVVGRTARYSKHSTYGAACTVKSRAVRMTDCIRNFTNSRLISRFHGHSMNLVYFKTAVVKSRKHCELCNGKGGQVW